MRRITTIAFKPLTMNLNGILEMRITVKSPMEINIHDAIPLKEKSAIMYISVANNFTLGSSLWMADSAG
jgi:hypothetical protein